MLDSNLEIQVPLHQISQQAETQKSEIKNFQIFETKRSLQKFFGKTDFLYRPRLEIWAKLNQLKRSLFIKNQSLQ